MFQRHAAGIYHYRCWGTRGFSTKQSIPWNKELLWNRISISFVILCLEVRRILWCDDQAKSLCLISRKCSVTDLSAKHIPNLRTDLEGGSICLHISIHSHTEAMHKIQLATVPRNLIYLFQNVRKQGKTSSFLLPPLQVLHLQMAHSFVWMCNPPLPVLSLSVQLNTHKWSVECHSCKRTGCRSIVVMFIIVCDHDQIRTLPGYF